MSVAESLPGRLIWELRRATRRFHRRFGWPGSIILTCMLSAVMANAWREDAVREELSLRYRAKDNPAPRQAEAQDPYADNRLQLKAFESSLPSSDEIPYVLQDLVRLAEAEQLTLVRGDYRPGSDRAGGFIRYQMSLPVKGDSAAVLRFMRAALRAHPTLALQSLQFSRERSESREVSVRILWVLMTRLPEPPRPRGIE